MASETPSVNLQSQRALRALEKGKRSKSRLAVETYGDDNPSTRSMISRLSKQLIEGGWAVERKEGRERVMQITEAGRALVQDGSQQSGKQEPVPSIPTLGDAVGSMDTPGDEPLHPHDRPRFHLRHGALLALFDLHKKGVRTTADEHYESMLRTLVHDDGRSEAMDKRVFNSLATSWPNADSRKRLMGCLVDFQYPDPSIRRETGPEFVLLADRMSPGAEAVLWASGAIDLAHHYSFAPTSQIDRMTARKLLRHAKDLLDKTRQLNPLMRIAVDYRLGKIGKVASAGWGWEGQENEPSAAQKLTAPSTDEERLVSVLRKMDRAVLRAGRFNFALESFERVLRNYLGRWVLLALPSSEWVFRRAGGLNIAREIHDWAIDVRERGALGELLVSRVRDPENEPLRKTLREFLSIGKRFRQENSGMQLDPYMAQAQALLGEPIDASLEPEIFDPEAGYYQRMLMNNIWNPEMVAAHTVAAATKGSPS